MGPRSEERGNWSVTSMLLETTRCFNGAALGRTRKLASAPNPPGDPGASMGPRSEERGNTASKKPATAIILLQWGRARKNAETFISHNERYIITALQWGRARKNAETPHASGSDPCRRLLQWGRARKNAETPHLGNAGQGIHRLQWGRARKNAETTIVYMAMKI